MTRPRSIVRVSPVERDPGCRGDVVADPERADEVAAGAARDQRHVRGVVEPGEPVHDLVAREPSPPTTTSRRAPPSAASRASSPRWPRRSLIERVALEPDAGGRWAISGQRRPVEPFAAAGLTRKTVSLRALRP